MTSFSSPPIADGDAHYPEAYMVVFVLLIKVIKVGGGAEDCICFGMVGRFAGMASG
jgi:hypothetical protein